MFKYCELILEGGLTRPSSRQIQTGERPGRQGVGWRDGQTDGPDGQLARQTDKKIEGKLKKANIKSTK